MGRMGEVRKENLCNLRNLRTKLQITKYKLQTNHNPKITNYKQKAVLRIDFKRLRRKDCLNTIKRIFMIARILMVPFGQVFYAFGEKI